MGDSGRLYPAIEMAGISLPDPKRNRRSEPQTDTTVSVVSIERNRRASRALVISTLIGMLMGAVEVGLFFVTGNRGLLTDGFANLVWIVPGTLSVISVRLGQLQADWRMHYGYRRVETLMVLLFGLAICGFAITQIADTLL